MNHVWLPKCGVEKYNCRDYSRKLFLLCYSLVATCLFCDHINYKHSTSISELWGHSTSTFSQQPTYLLNSYLKTRHCIVNSYNKREVVALIPLLHSPLLFLLLISLLDWCICMRKCCINLCGKITQRGLRFDITGHLSHLYSWAVKWMDWWINA